ncbi:acyl-CoA synthetase [Mycobacterium paraintracellulare]|uniref:Acyl-CoA ligase n=1 Tax=Mycobacterium paraintracellulare TaxID=1138383 RepID=A0ABN6AR58_9MYCO|nr:acyl-CoA synthetase [Mycobacterium paraintracellulare]AFC53171.1 AMP-binding protein [Mycobacterium paraintracellulare]OSC23292.1 acyl-CoA synthetase [Mycobacterium paraintracellulare]BBY71338.1 putative acyl-CoA ligase [Mycobacterium paraintracellulare]
MYPGTHAATAPDRPAVILAETGVTLTYGDLDERSARLASALHGLGVRRGDVVAMLTDNVAEAFEIYWAALRSGLYVTAINRHLAVGEAAYIVRDSGARVLFASAGVRDLAQQMVSEIAEVAQRFAFGGELEGYESYERLLATAGPRLTDQPRGSDMLYSSGTTGRPKGIKPHLLPIQVDEPGDPLTAMLAKVFGLSESDVYLSAAPIYHAAPLKYCAAVQALGGTVVLMKKFDAEESLAAIERYRVSVTQMVPTMFVRLLQLPERTRTKYDISSLRLAVHAGAPCPPEVKDAMLAWWGPILVEYYSATEAHGTTIMTSAEWPTKRGSVGRAVLGVVHVCDDDGRELPAGEVGTVYFERDAVPFVYHNDPEKTASSRHPRYENWSTVGDLGYLDNDGYLYLTDRKSFMIISGGVNIYPQEIENVLTLHPKIFDVAVIGVPDPEMGEQVKAVVQLRDGVVGDDELSAELISYVRDRLAHFKAPKSVDFVDELPRSATGKLVKRTLRERYLEASA